MTKTQNIVQAFFRNDPRVIALITPGRKYSYGELFSLVRKTSARFRSKNISKGDRVLILHPPSVELYVQLLALFQVGAVPVFVDAWSGKERILQSAEIASCKGMIAGWKIRLFSFFYKELRNIPVKLGAGLNDNTEDDRIEEVNDDDHTLITFTTGSTGTPKAAIRTHGILTAQLRALEEKVHCENDGSVYTNLPVVLLISLAKGLPSVLPGFDPTKGDRTAELVKVLKQYKATSLIVSPSLALNIANRGLDDYRSNVKHVVTGGAPVFPADAEAICSGFVNADCTVVYGSTEAEPVSSATVEEIIFYKNELANKGLYAGKVSACAEVAIISNMAHPVTRPAFLAHNEAGEIVVSGPHVVQKYFGNEEAVRETKFIHNGKLFHRTGDAGCLDEGGNLFLLGRLKYSFLYNGKMNYLFPLEEEIKKISGIKCGTILQIGDDLHFFAEGGNEKEIREWLNKKQMNAAIHIIEEIPRDARHHSRINYEALIRQVEVSK